jgi:hypothetical protein
MLQEKEAIVAKAYIQPDKIKETARLHCMQPKDIWYWAKTLNEKQAFPHPWKACNSS